MSDSKSERRLLSGDEAFARGAWEAGVRVACAYPGTPSTEILQALAGCPEVDTQWSVNEKVALEVAWGAAIGGVRSLYASKHVGLNVAMDPLMTAAYTGVSGGLIVAVCDDPGLHSSQNEQDTRWVAPYGKLPLVEPADPAEARAFAAEAFRLSEAFDIPVLFRMTTRVAHSKQDVEVGPRVDVPPRPWKTDIPKYVMVPRHAAARHADLEARLLRLKAEAERSPLNRVETGPSGLGFVTTGVSYLYLKEAFPDASFLKLGFSHPFCDDRIRAFAAQVKELVVVEELDPILEEHLRTLGVPFRAKHPGYRLGELRPEYMPGLVRGEPKTDQPSPGRKPVLCPGCSHRMVFNVLKELKLTVAGDIGCYTLGASPPLSALHTCLCMGGGVTVHEGLRRAVPGGRIVGVIGDSTFIHSGIPGLINAAYNRVKGLLLILDNATTAMTGAQPHPGTGRTIRGEPAPTLRLEDLCRACGADRVDVIDPKDKKALKALVKERVEAEALSVIIVRAPCWQLDKPKHQAPKVDAAKCRECHLCLSIDCPAVVKNEDDSIRIDLSRCVGCNLCVRTCPFGALLSNEG